MRSCSSVHLQRPHLGNSENKIVAVAGGLECDPTTFGCEFHRIGEQVREDLVELAGILTHLRTCRIIHDHFQIDVLFLGLLPEYCCSVAGADRGRIQGLKVHSHLVGFQLCQVENIVDKGEHPVRSS